MDFQLGEKEEALRGDIRDFTKEKLPPGWMMYMLEEESRDQDWEFCMSISRKLSQKGWLTMSWHEEYGGSDANILDLMIFIEEMGGRLLSGPFFSTMALCSMPILEYGSDFQKKEFLPEIAAGRQVWTLAFTGQGIGNDLSEKGVWAASDQDGYILTGTIGFVPYAHVADYMLVTAGTGADRGKDTSVFIVDVKSEGLSVEVMSTTARDKQCEVRLENVKVPAIDMLGKVKTGRDIVGFILDRGAVLKSAEMLGGVRAVLEMTNAYAKERIQFDRPIGSFQAIQHKLADLFIEIEGLSYVVYEAAWSLSRGLESGRLISMAKAKANEVYERTCIECMRIHGAVGFTRELDLGLYHLRTRSYGSAMGDSGFHRERIAMELEAVEAPACQIDRP